MIISCPSCATRYQWAENPGSDRLTITCQVCHHAWRQNHVIDVQPIITRNLPAVSDIDHGFEPEMEVQRLVEAARDAKDSYLAQQKLKKKRLQAWAILGALTISPFIAAAAYPAQIVNIAPISLKAYQALGYDINIYGLEIKRVSQQYVMIEGQRVLTIKGEVQNISSTVQKIPALRFGLADADRKEVYQWTLDTGAKPLRVGETTGFVTRVAAPPETSQTVNIRFARQSEISSTLTP